MKRHRKRRIVEKNLNEHVRQENVAYRKIIRKRVTAVKSADDKLDPSADAHLFATGHLPPDF